MTRPIKFRGRTKCGKLVHGDLRHMVETEGIGCLVASTRHYVTVGDIEVTPDSVAQLVGYDKNGAEVYEGDTVLRYDSEEEFIEAPENGVLREVVLYTQVNPDLEAYYCLVKEIHQ